MEDDDDADRDRPTSMNGANQAARSQSCGQQQETRSTNDTKSLLNDPRDQHVSLHFVHSDRPPVLWVHTILPVQKHAHKLRREEKQFAHKDILM